MDFVRTSTSEAETAVIGRALGGVLQGGDVVLLDGPLGAGKTTLVRGIAEGMGLDTSPVASPTFVLIHEYEHPGRGIGLIHVDAYRLRDIDDLESIGWDRVMARVDAGEAALVVEWAGRLGPRFLEEHNPARIAIEHAGEHEREFAFVLPDTWRQRGGFGELTVRAPTRCPVTGKPVPPDSPTYPFSSERARLADLHRWFSESYQITRPLEQRDLEEGVD